MGFHIHTAFAAHIAPAHLDFQLAVGELLCEELYSSENVDVLILGPFRKFEGYLAPRRSYPQGWLERVCEARLH